MTFDLRSPDPGPAGLHYHGRAGNRGGFRCFPVAGHSGPVFAGGTLPQAESREGLVDLPLRVMVVEDEAVIAMDLEMILEGLGAEVVCCAATAADAVEYAQRHRPDCVTMDINIHGDRDGVSAAVEIYERFGIRSIFVSAFGNAETRERGARAHPIDWISKPFEEEEIERVLTDFTTQA